MFLAMENVRFYILINWEQLDVTEYTCYQYVYLHSPSPIGYSCIAMFSVLIECLQNAYKLLFY